MRFWATYKAYTMALVLPPDRLLSHRCSYWGMVTTITTQFIAAAVTGGAAVVVLTCWLQRRRQQETPRPRPITSRRLVRLPGSSATREEVSAALMRDGCVVVEDLADPAAMAQLSDDVAALAGTEYAGGGNSFAGHKTYRCGSLCSNQQTCKLTNDIVYAIIPDTNLITMTHHYGFYYPRHQPHHHDSSLWFLLSPTPTSSP